jgi:phosphate transport system permease protein
MPRTPLFRRRRRLRIAETTFREILRLAALVTILTTVGIVVTLLFNAFEFFRTVSPLTFLTGTQWTPLFANPQYGVLPLVIGTFTVALGAALFRFQSA